MITAATIIIIAGIGGIILQYLIPFIMHLGKQPHEIQVKRTKDQNQQAKKGRLIGQVLTKKNCPIWEIEEDTGVIQLAKFQNVLITGSEKSATTRATIVMKPGCAYVQAINKKNASRKFLNNQIRG